MSITRQNIQVLALIACAGIIFILLIDDSGDFILNNIGVKAEVKPDLTETGTGKNIYNSDSVLQNFPKYHRMFEMITLEDAQLLFHRLATRQEHTCNEIKRYGLKGDTGYDVCITPPYKPDTGNCLVYSVGINNQWSFDDAISDQFDCEIHAFDPSMKVGDHKRREKIYFHQLGLWGSDITDHHGWRLNKLSTLRKELGHSNRSIDILKIDAEGAEWPFLHDVIKSHDLNTVKQLILEIHTPRWSIKGEKMSKADYAEIYDLISNLHELGFRNYQARHENNCCGHYATLMPNIFLPVKTHQNLCCYELFFININLKAK